MRYGKAFNLHGFVKLNYTGAVADNILLDREINGTFHIKLFKSMFLFSFSLFICCEIWAEVNTCFLDPANLQIRLCKTQ